jgi:putative membrane protein
VVTGETESQNSKGAGARSLTGETTATTTTIEPVTSATVAVNTDAGAANSQGDGARVLTGTTETTENVQNDAAFVRTAAQAGLAEVKMGQLAQQNAGNQAVKDFGQKLVTDHSKANDELMQIASRKNLQAPAEMSAKDNEMIQHLSTLNGTEFDKACGRHAVTAHEKAVKLFKTEAQSGQDPELKAFAQKTLPTLEEHLRVAKQLNVGAKEE